jgi:hypothetical protein
VRPETRWNLLPPAIVTACFGVAIAGMAVYVHVEQAFCALGNYSEGTCYGFEADDELAIVMNVFLALAAFVIMSVAVVVAPSRKRQVAQTTFVVGSVLAFAFGLLWGEPAYTASAVSAGLLCLVIVQWVLRRDDAHP